MTLEEAISLFERLMSSLPSEGARIMSENITKVVSQKATGALARSVTGSGNGGTIVIRTNTGYGKFVDDGRGPVAPKGKSSGGKDWLHWDDPEWGEVFTKYAGPAPAKPFAVPTAEAIVDYINNFK